ncbi:hypothetical protein [Paraburkholderia fynbosensis]|uniref:Uncharacterized protein n=1 Tax=Paraburkholderia fynbosensis TaxID=1200993 RepID=A0A6J5GSW5_9BURK|nr:hypothetical protein [Paraburkholderia fynbosensis]CAB3803110.1 hypothetical protein LMG27177_05390 [Paraburkholderia fynbosensis]
MTIRIEAKEDILAPGIAAGLLSTAALALCGKLHGKRATAPVSAVSHWLWPQEARRTAHPAPRHVIAGLLIHLTMSIGWAGFNAVALAALRDALERHGGSTQDSALAGIAQASAENDAEERGSEVSADGPKKRAETGRQRGTAGVHPNRSREHNHRMALAVGTTVAAAVGDYIVVPKRFTPGFEYHLPAAHITAVYVAFGAGLMAPFMLKQWMNRGSATRR